MGITITQTRVIVCEGEGDKAFFKHLIAERALSNFDIFHPAQADGVPGGVSGYRDFLTALSVPLALRSVSGILLVADNDTDPRISFRFVQQQIRDATELVQAESGAAYGVPLAPMEVARSERLPPIVVMMLPWTDEPGNLETLCLEAVYAARADLKECLDQYCECAGTNDWDISRQSKMRLGCMLAALSHSKPATLRYAWDRPEVMIPLRQPCFDRTADVLQRFDDIVATS